MRFEDLPIHNDTGIAEDAMLPLFIELSQELTIVRGDLHVLLPVVHLCCWTKRLFRTFAGKKTKMTQCLHSNVPNLNLIVFCFNSSVGINNRTHSSNVSITIAPEHDKVHILEITIFLASAENTLTVYQNYAKSVFFFF